MRSIVLSRVLARAAQALGARDIRTSSSDAGRRFAAKVEVRSSRGSKERLKRRRSMVWLKATAGGGR